MTVVARNQTASPLSHSCPPKVPFTRILPFVSFFLEFCCIILSAVVSIQRSSCFDSSCSPLIWSPAMCAALETQISPPCLPRYASITCSLERGWWSDGPPWLGSKNNRANFPPVRRRFHTNLRCTAQLRLSETARNKVQEEGKARGGKYRSALINLKRLLL